MLSHLRREYSLAGLSEADLHADPFQQFHQWLREALAAEIPEPNAMVLATVSAEGRPRTRTVLLKAADERGFTFFTNYESRKARELAANVHAAFTFPWVALERQVCVTGRVTKVSREESAAYFRTRPRGSRLGAWASQQSEVIAGRAELEERMRQAEARYPEEDVPLPPNWGGYLLTPDEIEFWQGRPSRLHDRLRFTRTLDGPWRIDRLSP